jgi:ATP-dependent Zn protease
VGIYGSFFDSSADLFSVSFSNRSQAAIQASKQGCREVMLTHFEWAKDRIIMGSERKSAFIDEKNKLMTAYHEV